jgi:hypothetical protein
MPPIQGVNPKTEEVEERHTADSEPLAALVFKIVTVRLSGDGLLPRLFGCHQPDRW